MPILGKDADMVIVDDPFADGYDPEQRRAAREWFEREMPERIKDHPTRNMPFGRDVDTLVLCKSDDHLGKVVQALGMKAQYEIWSCSLMGSRFKKIIWLAGFGDSASEHATIARMIREYLPTKLEPGGVIIVL